MTGDVAEQLVGAWAELAEGVAAYERWFQAQFGRPAAEGRVGYSFAEVSLIGPLLPTPEALGISPTALAVALICGWILTGITSPFTATTLLIARFGGITPYQVGWVWNRGFFCAVTVLLSLWVLLFAYVLG